MLEFSLVNTMIVFVFVFNLQATNCLQKLLLTDKSCDASKGETCVDIWKCPYFSDLLNRTKIPRPKHVVKSMREQHCGFTEITPKVCCVITKQHNSVIEERIGGPPDVSNHKNLALLTEDCGSIATDFRVVGGTETSLYEFPWMALIAYMTKDGLDFRCGGTLINNAYVLTAAHCILNLTVVGVRLGEHNVNTDVDCNLQETLCSPGVQDFYVKEIIVHPNYAQSTYTNDIALIRLAAPANLSYPNVQPVCLPLADMANYNLAKKFAIVTGWGVTETGFKSAELLKIFIPVLTNSECNRIYKRFATVDERQICAGGYMGRDSCSGDSGGPLVHAGLVGGVPRYVQHGIVSYGPRHCGSEGQPGVYVRVSYYMDWILDNLKPLD